MHGRPSPVGDDCGSDPEEPGAGGGSGERRVGGGGEAGLTRADSGLRLARQGKSYLTIAFGCTGGHHRSVMIADQIRKNLVQAGYKAKATHRGVVKPV